MKSENRDIRDYLNDIIESSENILEFTKDMTFDSFSNDKKTLLAVIRCLEVIGEAVKNIPVATRLAHPSLPWKQMAGMRDKLIHEYFGINKHMVWQVVANNIGQILNDVKKIKDTL